MNNQIANNSGDKKYFTITPQIVWAYSRSPYDFTLWTTIKMIAGDDGECWVSTSNLAKLAMMSTGKVSECRKYLIKIGLLEGQQKQANNNGQYVWHISIPDLWEENVKWRTDIGDSLSARIELKETQKSLHLKKPSPDEGKPSPDETKDNKKVKPLLSSTNVEDAAQQKPTNQEIPPISEKKAKQEVSPPRQPGPKPKRPPAVNVFREKALRFPNKALWTVISSIVGDEPDDLDFWGVVVFNYIACGWNPGNVKAMLEFYKRREIPAIKKPNGNGANGTHKKASKSTLDQQPSFDPYTSEYVYPDGRRTKTLVPDL